MKTVILTISEVKRGCCDFTPKKKFKAKWVLDLHGFLPRDKFKERLNEINHHMQGYPLMSEKMKKRLNRLSGMLATLIGVIVLMVFVAGAISGGGGAMAAAGILEALIVGLTIFANYRIEEKAKELARNFKNNIKLLLDDYNNRDNPTANWRFQWRTELSHYKIDAKVRSQGNITGKMEPKYVEHAEIVLEIHDALSDLTADTVTVNSEISKIPKEKIVTTVTTINL
ncbi:12978_t:CDS:1 [Dentiscutata heterogama]|uniref:12978_t:CDS:1 n=1 Tax=Dentiscutata heterogama TaxID=1316150 RepID=A0ACA9KCC7_9GLOM|nr:12978_t:CDS:1 [Dentiscutata heterogama]